MPRSGQGVYSLPTDTQAVPNAVIESGKFNSVMADIAADLNAPRPVTAGGTGATSATGARDFLGIGDAGRDDVVTIAHGGTGAITAPNARTNLGVAIGTNVQAYAAVLTNLAGIAGSAAADKFPYLTSATAWAYGTVTTFARTLLAAVDAPAARTALGLKDLAVKDLADLFYGGTSLSNIDYPIGSTIACICATDPVINSVVVPRLNLANDFWFVDNGAGTALIGTWRSRGRTFSSGYLLQRTA